MTLPIRPRTTWLMVLLMLAGGCALSDLPQEEEDIDPVEDQPTTEKVVDTTNGLSTINGLSSTNGLMAVNGLSTRNGLRVVNGVVTINGLATKNGMRTINGQSVNCATSASCTGAPDGLLDAQRGLLKDAPGVNLARYVVRCALPAGRTIRAKLWNAQLISLRGEIGFAPEWETGQCNADCQEKVSACLLALVNGSGKHVPLEISAAWATGALGEAPDPEYLREAVFFGNIFKSPPQAYVAMARDWGLSLLQQTGGLVIPVPRMCTGFPGVTPGDYFSQAANCPIKIVGLAGHEAFEATTSDGQYIFAENYDLCYMTPDASQAVACMTDWALRDWFNFPVSTFVWQPSW